MNPALKDIVKEELQKLLDAGFIYLISDIEWVSPLMLVPKKNGKWRICVDYRELNKAKKKDHFPLPFIDQVLDDLAGNFFLFHKWVQRESLSNLGKVLNKCIEMNLSLSLEKCEFLMTAGIVLGHSISQEGLQVDPNKIAIIKRVPTLKKQRDVRSFLCLAGCYRRFIKYFSKLASRLFGLLTKDSEFLWSESYQKASDTLKDKLTTAPILRGPNWALPFHIHTDASHKAIGAALG
eukprot:PITA_22722